MHQIMEPMVLQSFFSICLLSLVVPFQAAFAQQTQAPAGGLGNIANQIVPLLQQGLQEARIFINLSRDPYGVIDDEVRQINDGYNITRQISHNEKSILKESVDYTGDVLNGYLGDKVLSPKEKVDMTRRAYQLQQQIDALSSNAEVR